VAVKRLLQVLLQLAAGQATTTHPQAVIQGNLSEVLLRLLLLVQLLLVLLLLRVEHQSLLQQAGEGWFQKAVVLRLPSQGGALAP